MAKTALVRASEDRAVPTTFVGTVVPNWYCRGWNAKRLKYCRSRAGRGTQHPRVGRCMNHGGASTVKHGRYSTIEAPRIRELLEQFDDADPLDVVDDLNLARALLRDYIERASAGKTGNAPAAKTIANTLDEYEILLLEGDGTLEEADQKRLAGARIALATLAAEHTLPDLVEAVRGLDVVSKMIHRLQMLRTAGAVSLDQVRRFLASVDRVLQLHLEDEQLRATIRKDIYAVRV